MQILTLTTVGFAALGAAFPLEARDDSEHATTVVGETTTQKSTEECQRWRIVKDVSGKHLDLSSHLLNPCPPPATLL